MKASLRINLVLASFFLLGALVAARLFYWQILNQASLSAAAAAQHWISFEIPAQRGEILAADGFPLVSNQDSFLLFASLPDLEAKPEAIAAQIAPLLNFELTPLEAEVMIKERLRREDLVWVPLKHKVSRESKRVIEELAIAGLGFEEEFKRAYPEGSAAAHLLGFVGADVNGRDLGYFGLEGYYDLELRGRSGLVRREKDASGKPILIGEAKKEKETNGRTLLTTIERPVQFIIEEKLKAGLKKYGANSGSIVVMEPQTGAVLALATLPDYDPDTYWQYDKQLFPNPVINSSFEPGSVFKVLVMAAALDSGVVKPETRCDQCTGSRYISGYEIETWNQKYFPDSTMVEVIQHSDNVGMVFVSEKLGADKLVDYLQAFGIGQLTGIDLQEEATPELRSKEQWKTIDLATASFGQGVAVTPLQMIRAVGAIANQGKLVKPFVVKEVRGEEGSSPVFLDKGKSVIKPATARLMTEIMVNAVDNGEAKWAKPEGFRIAGKTGTAQIPIAGHYDEEKTIASFVGFAPADQPRFVMLVTLKEPTSSPWGSETAAPLWFDIAKELFTYFGILPE